MLARLALLSLALTTSALAVSERPTIPILDAPTLSAACNQAIDDAKAAYAKLEALPIEQASVASVLDAWNDAFIALEDVSGPAGTLVSVHPDAKVRDAGRACRAKLSSFWNEIYQSEKLFERVNAVATTDAVAQQFKKSIIASFEDSGVTLPTTWSSPRAASCRSGSAAGCDRRLARDSVSEAPRRHRPPIFLSRHSQDALTPHP